MSYKKQILGQPVLEENNQGYLRITRSVDAWNRMYDEMVETCLVQAFNNIKPDQGSMSEDQLYDLFDIMMGSTVWKESLQDIWEERSLKKVRTLIWLMFCLRSHKVNKDWSQ